MVTHRSRRSHAVEGTENHAGDAGILGHPRQAAVDRAGGAGRIVATAGRGVDDTEEEREHDDHRPVKPTHGLLRMGFSIARDSTGSCLIKSRRNSVRRLRWPAPQGTMREAASRTADRRIAKGLAPGRG